MAEVIDRSISTIICLDAKGNNSHVQLLFYKENNHIEYCACKCDESDSPIEFITIYPSGIKAYLEGKSFEYTTGWNKGKTVHSCKPEELDKKIPEFFNLIKSIDDYLKTNKLQIISKV